jgi:drug/metabolite transporter (DMT)-like permease
MLKTEPIPLPAAKSRWAWLSVPALTAVLIWGGTFPIAKFALDEFSVLSYATIRPFVASGIIFTVLRFRGEPLGIAREDWPRLLLAGFAGMFLFQAGFIFGLDLTSASHSAIIASAGPPILGMLALWLLRGDRPTGRMLAGLAVGGGGVILLVGDPSADGASILGDLISLGAALAWVGVTIIPEPLVRRYGAFRVTAWMILCSAVAFLPISAGELIETAQDMPSPLAWGSLFYTGIFGMTIANSLWQRAVHSVGVSQTMPYLYLQPAVALGLAAVMLGERLGPVQLAGGLLAMVGVALVRR